MQIRAAVFVVRTTPFRFQFGGKFFVYEKRDSLRAGILIEKFDVVQIRVVKRIANFFQRGFEFGKIQQHPAFVQFFAPDMRENFVIVAVQIFALAIVIAQKMRRRKISLNTNLIHKKYRSINQNLLL